MHVCVRIHRDVTQSAFYLLARGGLREKLDEIYVLGLLLGALIHDIGHDGFNNHYHKHAGTARADAFNDQSIQVRLALTL